MKTHPTLKTPRCRQESFLVPDFLSEKSLALAYEEQSRVPCRILLACDSVVFSPFYLSGRSLRAYRVFALTSLWFTQRFILLPLNRPSKMVQSLYVRAAFLRLGQPPQSKFRATRL